MMSISKILDAQTHCRDIRTVGANTFNPHCNNINPACTNSYKATLLADLVEVPLHRKKGKQKKKETEHDELVSCSMFASY